MQIDMADIGPVERYKLLASTVTPRPIAWITTQSSAGARNAAPFSFFNVMASDPAIIAFGVVPRPDGSIKDTTRNILETGEFVVNMVSDDDGDAMNLTCIDAPPECDELAMGGIETVPSVKIAPPRIASAPASMECRLYQTIELGPDATMILGEVVAMHVDDRFVLNPARFHFDPPAMKLLARMHGSGWYIRATDLRKLTRPTYAQWLTDQKPNL